MISEFPLFIFTTLGGLSAGLVMAMAAFPPAEKPARPWLAPLTALVLLGVGMLGVLFHLKKPALFLLALRNPAAGIAQEAYCGIVLGLLLLALLVMSWRKGGAPRALTWIAAGVSLIMAFVMGFAYVTNVGTAAWANWTTVPLFVAGDIAMGLALWAVLSKGALEKRPFALTAAVVLAVSAATMLLTGLHFGSVGQGAALLYAGLAVTLAGAAVAVVAAKKPAAWQAGALIACALVGTCLARWAFYAASII